MFNLKRAFITGISGQDGSYLASLLINKGYEVIGLVRSFNHSSLAGLEYLKVRDKVLVEECDLTDLSQIISLIAKYRPQEVYNLAAQSSVSLSFKQPIGTFHFNTISVYNLLEAIKLTDKTIKFYQASSSEMFGKVNKLPISSSSVFHPLSPYAISKAAAHWICVNYRESFNMFICCGILFNHESYLRTPNYFIKKIINECISISAGRSKSLSVGNIDIQRDFGYAPRYVECMHLMMQYETPREFTICSGESVSLRSIIYYLFDKLNIKRDSLIISSELFRPSEIEDIYGDPSDAKNLLKWNYDISFFDVLDLLVEEEIENLKYNE